MSANTEATRGVAGILRLLRESLRDVERDYTTGSTRKALLLLAVPILLQVFFNSGLAYLLNRRVRSPHCVAGPSALIGASNFFELAVATAIVLFGFDSGAALATVVGVLIEVPVMLAAVRVVNATRGWYERAPGVVPHEQCCPPAA